MKKNTNENRPGFALMKLSGAISYFHMQMPRWPVSYTHLRAHETDQ